MNRKLPPTPSARTNAHLDRVATILSVACAIECLVFPFLVGLLPLIGIEFVSNHWVETGVCVCALLLCTYNQARGFQVHRNSRVLLLFAIAGAFLLGGHLFLPEGAERISSVIGAVFLVSTQYANKRLASSCSCHLHESRPKAKIKL
jgi:hypothetical protein